jgi:hypothetical protein
MWRDWRSITPRALLSGESLGWSNCSSLVAFKTAASGFRSSCESIARNCSRRRAPARICSSASLRAVTSTKVTTAPETTPSCRTG